MKLKVKLLIYLCTLLLPTMHLHLIDYPKEKNIRLDDKTEVIGPIKLSSSNEIFNRSLKAKPLKKSRSLRKQVKRNAKLLLKSNTDADSDNEQMFLSMPEVQALRRKKNAKTRELKQDNSVTVDAGTISVDKIEPKEDDVNDISQYLPNIDDLNKIMEIKPRIRKSARKASLDSSQFPVEDFSTSVSGGIGLPDLQDKGGSGDLSGGQGHSLRNVAGVAGRALDSPADKVGKLKNFFRGRKMKKPGKPGKVEDDVKGDNVGKVGNSGVDVKDVKGGHNIKGVIGGLLGGLGGTLSAGLAMPPKVCSPAHRLAGKCKLEQEDEVKARLEDFKDKNEHSFNEYLSGKLSEKVKDISEASKAFNSAFENRRQMMEKSYQERLKTVTDIFHKHKQQIWDDDLASYNKQRNNNRNMLAKSIKRQIKKTINHDMEEMEERYKGIRERQIKELTKDMVDMYKGMYEDFSEHNRKVQEYYSITTEHSKEPQDVGEFLEEEVRDEGDALI